MSGSGEHKLTHVALLPSAGMGHLTPFIRLAAALASHDVRITFITPQPTVSEAESRTMAQFFAAFPQIMQQSLHLVPLDDDLPTSDDPIYHQYEVIRRSVLHSLPVLLSSLSPPASALVIDMSFAATAIPIAQALGLGTYVFFTSSAKMLALYLYFHKIAGPDSDTDVIDDDVVKISGLEPVPRSWMPPLLLQLSDNLFKTYFSDNGKKMADSDGVLVNTSESLEGETLAKLNKGEVIAGLPKVFSVGPLQPCRLGKGQPLAWLDGQPAGSVVFVSFGSRTAISRDQIRELGEGLVSSSSRFLWAVKDKKVDRDDSDELSEIVGLELMEKAKEKGLIVKSWLDQEEILGHPAVGGFISHCGWNSLTEAIWHGVPILAWPQHSDQKINAGLLHKAGFGIWDESWGWGGERVIKGEEIAEKIRLMMEDSSIRARATQVKDEGRRAVAAGGSSNKGLAELIDKCKKLKATDILQTDMM